MNFSKNLLVFTFLSTSLIAPLNIAAVDRTERREAQKALMQELATTIRNINYFDAEDVLARGAKVTLGHWELLKKVREAVEVNFEAKIRQAREEAATADFLSGADPIWSIEEGLSMEKAEVLKNLKKIEKALNSADSKASEAFLRESRERAASSSSPASA